MYDNSINAGVNGKWVEVVRQRKQSNQEEEEQDRFGLILFRLEIQKAERLREKYFNEKIKRNENIQFRSANR